MSKSNGTTKQLTKSTSNGSAANGHANGAPVAATIGLPIDHNFPSIMPDGADAPTRDVRCRDQHERDVALYSFLMGGRVVDHQNEKAIANLIAEFAPDKEEDSIGNAMKAVASDIDILALLTADSLVYCSQISPLLYRLRNRLQVVRELYDRKRKPVAGLPATVTGA